MDTEQITNRVLVFVPVQPPQDDLATDKIATVERITQGPQKLRLRLCVWPVFGFWRHFTVGNTVVEINPVTPDFSIRQVDRKTGQVETGFRSITEVTVKTMLFEERWRRDRKVQLVGCSTQDCLSIKFLPLGDAH